MREAAWAGVLAVALAWGWAPAADRVARRLGPTDPARAGVLRESVEGTLWVARQERLLAAWVSGQVRAAVGEGQAVPAGAVVATVQPPDGQQLSEVRAPFAGVVSFYGDGLERWDSPQWAFGLERPPPAQKVRPLVADGSVTAGQPVARLVDRGTLIAVFWARYPATDRGGAGGGLPEPGASAELVWEASAAGSAAQVLEVRRDGRSWRALLRVHRQPAEWLYRRRVDGVELSVRRIAGVIVPTSAVVERQGRPGVWVQTAGGATWVRVTVFGRVGDRSAVSGIPEGARVYRWPRWIRFP